MDALCAGGLLAGRYRLVRQLGVGGMSVVWHAQDEVLDRSVAVKVLAESLAADAAYRSMVRREAQAAAQLVHPHVTAVHDYGEQVAADGTVTAFVVMELVEGMELADLLAEGPLPWTDAVEICAQVAEALAAAHRLHIVHRDITPANVMLTSAGVKVLDFGIAARVGAVDSDDTGGLFGTPGYLAPERIEGRSVQPATDTYALGVLLFECLTGGPPHPTDSWPELVAAQQGDPPPLTGVPGLPSAVAEIYRRCLSPDPSARPATHRVAKVLRTHLPVGPQPEPVRAPTLPLVGARAVPPTRWVNVGGLRRRVLVWQIVTAVAAVVALTAGGVLWVSLRSEVDPASRALPPTVDRPPASTGTPPPTVPPSVAASRSAAAPTATPRTTAPRRSVAPETSPGAPASPAPADIEPRTLEAELGSLTGGAAFSDFHKGHLGRGFATVPAQGARVSFDVYTPQGGTRPVTVRYSNGNWFAPNATVSIYVNGVRAGKATLAQTANWDTWATHTKSLRLRAGRNTVVYAWDPGDTGSVNIDAITY
jgi:serine/threonine-protein kinase